MSERGENILGSSNLLGYFLIILDKHNKAFFRTDGAVRLDKAI